MEDGKVTHHEYKILLPQDVGGVIKGAGRVDVYCGNGDLGMAKASSLHHYGKMWVLLPKKNEQMALNE
jgi:membrane-bound lytic murein transglycosylase